MGRVSPYRSPQHGCDHGNSNNRHSSGGVCCALLAIAPRGALLSLALVVLPHPHWGNNASRRFALCHLDVLFVSLRAVAAFDGLTGLAIASANLHHPLVYSDGDW